MDESTPAAPPPIPRTAPLAPEDHAEAVAIFRSEIVGALTRRDLDHGELRAVLRALAAQPAARAGSWARPCACSRTPSGCWGTSRRTGPCLPAYAS